ncbi:MAG: hypothetical protein K9I02_00890 [Haliscomenobacter sp.]|nr:hypothetical protein [Haliscomenobacter sp.]
MGKVIVFVFVSLAILVVLTLLKESGAGAVTWLGVVTIPLIYKSMFGKKEEHDDVNKDITLKK